MITAYERACNAAKYCKENKIEENKALWIVQNALDYNYPIGRTYISELAKRIYVEGE